MKNWLWKARIVHELKRRQGWKESPSSRLWRGGKDIGICINFIYECVNQRAQLWIVESLVFLEKHVLLFSCILSKKKKSNISAFKAREAAINSNNIACLRQRLGIVDLPSHVEWQSRMIANERPGQTTTNYCKRCVATLMFMY